MAAQIQPHPSLDDVRMRHVTSERGSDDLYLTHMYMTMSHLEEHSDFLKLILSHGDDDGSEKFSESTSMIVILKSLGGGHYTIQYLFDQESG